MQETTYRPGLRSFDTLKGVLDFAIAQATEDGMTKGAELQRLAIVNAMRELGWTWELVTKVTGLDEEGHRILTEKYSESL